MTFKDKNKKKTQNFVLKEQDKAKKKKNYNNKINRKKVDLFVWFG